MSHWVESRLPVKAIDEKEKGCSRADSGLYAAF
jgi:hypothetical protein